jgi:hypothetical protein
MLAKTKPAPNLTQRIRQAADKVRAVDAELKDVIEDWVSEQKATRDGSGLPRESIRQMLISRHKEPWYAILHLESERRAHE